MNELDTLKDTMEYDKFVKKSQQMINKEVEKILFESYLRKDKNIKTGWIAQDVGKAGFNEAITIIDKELNGELISDYHLLDKEQMTTLLWASCSEMLKKIKYLEKELESLKINKM